MWEIIDLKYSIFTQIWLFLQQLKPCPTKGGKILVTHNQECKKKKNNNNNWKICAFFSTHETCLSILATISCNFQFVNTHTHIYIYIYSMIKSLYYS